MNTLVANQKAALTRKRQRAFTLVEMLAVIAVMLIILKLTLPSLDGILGVEAQGMARTQLVGDLNRARAKAFERGAPVYVVFMPLYNQVGCVPEGAMQPAAAKHQFFRGNPDANALLAGQLSRYALFAEYLPGDQPGRPSIKWLTDWKSLPAGYYFDHLELEALPEEVSVSHLKGVRPANSTMRLQLPAVKYNSRGELVGAGLRGIYLSVNKGGVLPPRLNQDGSFAVENADPPESLENAQRHWLHINAITGRAEVEELSESEAAQGLDLSDRLSSKYDLFIYAAPEWPEDLNKKLIRRYGNRSDFQANWMGVAPWSPVAGRYRVNRNAQNQLFPVFVGVPTRRDAIQLKWDLEKMYPKIGVRVESAQ